MEARKSQGLSISTSPSDFARSQVVACKPLLEATPEVDAFVDFKRYHEKYVKDLGGLKHDAFQSTQKTVIIDCLDFEIYRSPEKDSRRAYELTSLHLLDLTAKSLSLDGFLAKGPIKHYVRGISVQDLSIEGYGDEKSADVVAYIKPEILPKDPEFEIWLRLRQPAKNYQRFQQPFLWIAQFAKHILDFLDDQPRKTVDLHDFRKSFNIWITNRFTNDAAFQIWYQSYGKTDYRVPVHAYVGFIYNQAANLPNHEDYLSHPLWASCMREAVRIRPEPQRTKMTLATPSVHECFKNMYFGGNIAPVEPCALVSRQCNHRMKTLGFAVNMPRSRDEPQPPPKRRKHALSVRLGDVIGVVPNKRDQKLWKKANNEWLAYVQRIEHTVNGPSRLFVIWLYRPEDTSIGSATYPIDKELFMSDNCNCGGTPLYSTDACKIYDVDWLPSTLPTTRNVFVRQTYITQDSAFVTLGKDHFSCGCGNKTVTKLSKYQSGDNVYYSTKYKNRTILDPAIVHNIDTETGTVTLRKLLRHGRDCAAANNFRKDALPNELVLTDELFKKPVSKLRRHCQIKFVPHELAVSGQIPFPYDRKGAGDFWFISMGLKIQDGGQSLIGLARLPGSFKKGSFRDIEQSRKLTGLSIFSGGGNLDRGLEECGAVQFKHIVDLSPEAIHTQRANVIDPEAMNFFCGSVDDHFKALASGENPDFIGGVGKIRFLCGGSPCPGFSVKQRNILSAASLRNASHISSFCSYADMLRPEYGLLENVINMASTRKGMEDQNVLSQLIACLVSLGYQVRQYIVDAWCMGSMQRRSRLFLSIAAPGLAPIAQPPHTHSLPYEQTRGQSLGVLPNGQKLGEREYYPTPFSAVTAAGGTADLPDIGNGNSRVCISYPDHRLAWPMNRKTRALIECIPLSPPGSGYVDAMRHELIPPLLQKSHKAEFTRSYRRINSTELMGTITTSMDPQDARGSPVLHWAQQRPITLLEARRAQGYLDEEPIIGSLAKQWAIVGNGVDRKKAFALGLCLRRAFEANSKTRVASAQEVREFLEELQEGSSSKEAAAHPATVNPYDHTVGGSGQEEHSTVILPSRSSRVLTTTIDDEMLVDRSPSPEPETEKHPPHSNRPASKPFPSPQLPQGPTVSPGPPQSHTHPRTIPAFFKPPTPASVHIRHNSDSTSQTPHPHSQRFTAPRNQHSILTGRADDSTESPTPPTSATGTLTPSSGGKRSRECSDGGAEVQGSRGEERGWKRRGRRLLVGG